MNVLQTPTGLFGDTSSRAGQALDRSSRRRLAAAGLLLPILSPLAAAAGPPPAELADPASPPVVREELTVTDSRLRDLPESSERVPAHVTILDRGEIEAAAATTLQELLAYEAGVVLFDASGAELSSTLDLRGFAGGGVKVYLDGAPLNDPRNNSLSLELISPTLLDRVEITRGSVAALAGGGAEGGVIHLFTRAGDSPGGRLDLEAGELETLDGALSGWGRGDRSDFFASAAVHRTDGFRDNAGGELERLGAVAGWDLGPGRLRLSLLAAGSELGNPGALRPDELAADRTQAPFNRLDFSDEQLTQATLNFGGAPAAGLSLTANLFGRERDNDILTTGRAAPAFGGFFLESSTSLVGATGQLSRFGPHRELVGGVEWLDGETAARGTATPAADPGAVDPAARASDNTTDRRTSAAYLQQEWRPGERWTLVLGARWDEEEVAYRESVPDPANVDRRRYSQLSLRAGAVWTWRPGLSGWLSYGEAFRPPTVEELFSFPLFGSNPGLEPEDSRSLEIGLRRAGDRGRFDAALFEIETRDEIVFDPDSPMGLFGANVNAGETRRRGLELVYRARPLAALGLFASVTWIDAELTGGANRGKTVPLVPSERLGLGLEARLTDRLHLRANALWVGEQVLDNDDANLQPLLDSYSVADARLSWQLGRRQEAAGELFVAAHNLFDQAYSTRGIFAFDFSTFQSSVFLTPAPGRRLAAGLAWAF